MKSRIPRAATLAVLALVFTIGLTFATVELPYLVDGVIKAQLHTPGFDSQVDEVSRLKTELFIAHYHLRALGYLCFGVMLLLIVAGFATRRTGLAMLGGLAFMLPVFAQFASVMFFLAGLGLLNVLWLPVLDVSFDLAELGAVIRAPYDGLRWLLGLLGVNGYRPLVYFFTGSGLLLFFLGTFAWLSARSRKQGVADFWVYRLSRHPQYLGWILWSYGLFLLLLQGRYPKRSWGISASLPWLISTMVIIGVAMLEELGMRKKHGEEYESYTRSAPFLIPLPGFLRRFFALPFRVLFKKDRPDRKREVAAVLSLYTVLLMSASFLFYGGGMDRIKAALRSEAEQQAHIADLVNQLKAEPAGRWTYLLTEELAESGDASVEPLLKLLQDPNASVRAQAARAFVIRPDERAFPLLVEALSDPSENVRSPAYQSLHALGSQEAVRATLVLLNDPAMHIRIGVLNGLAGFGTREILEPAYDLLENPAAWVRAGAATALGILGSEEAIPRLTESLQDQEAWVRQDAVIALYRIGSPQAMPALEEAMDDEDWEVRLYAAEAVKRVSRMP